MDKEEMQEEGERGKQSRSQKSLMVTVEQKYCWAHKRYENEKGEWDMQGVMIS